MASLPSGNQRHSIRFGAFEADLRSGELRRNGGRVKLQEQPFQILVMLLERPGEVVTREELRLRLWPGDTFVDFDHGLNTAINKLRAALDDRADNPRFIETLARRGYRFIAPVASEAGETAAPPADHAVEASAQISSVDPAQVGELPQVHRGIGRFLFGLIQVMYLIFYIVSLARLGRVGEIGSRASAGFGRAVFVVVLLTAVLGIPVRLYLLSAVSFDYRGLGAKFRRLFPFVLPLDCFWALAPFLLVEQIGFGLAFAATAALLYVPFSQRSLVRMTYA